MNIGIKLTACITIGLICAGCGGAQKNKGKDRDQTPVVELLPTSVEVNHSYVADIQAVQFVEVQPKVSGFMAKIHVDEGQLVHKGQLMFTLYPFGFVFGHLQLGFCLFQIRFGFFESFVVFGRIQRKH